MLSEFILCGLPSTKAEVQKYLQPNWSFRHEIAVLDGIALKGRRSRITQSTARQGTEKHAPEPHRNKEDMATGM